MARVAAMALVGVAAVVRVADGLEARPWDELRISSIEPHKVSKPPLDHVEYAGFASYFSTFGWGMNALRLDGASVINSANFRFNPLQQPYEWSAMLMGPQQQAPKLYVGRTCHCDLAGLSAYAKDDTAWLRLHLERCFGCVSTAARSAIVVPLFPSDGGDSNLFAWICAVNPTDVCNPKFGTTTTTRTTTTATTTTTTTSLTTSSTTTTSRAAENTPECKFLAVETSETGPDRGECNMTGAHSFQRNASSESTCKALCIGRYMQRQEDYVTVDALNGNLPAINAHPDTCTGFAYNPSAMHCIVYVGSPVISDPSATDDHWKCYSKIVATKFYWKMDTSPKCLPTTTVATTTTITATSTTKTHSTTTTTQTTTTITTTLHVEDLNLVPVLGDVTVDTNIEDNTDPHRPVPRASEATVLSFQSPCYTPVDYYMLGRSLPVNATHWDHLMRMLTQSPDLGAWTDSEKRCCASVTVDRVVIDTGTAQHSSYSRVMGMFTRVVDDGASRSAFSAAVTLTLIVITAISFSGMALSVFIKENCFGEDGCNRCHPKLGIVGAIVSCIACCLAFVAAQIFCWLAENNAVREVYNQVSQKLSSCCLPVASVVLGASFVFWYWPLRAPLERPQTAEIRDMTISYKPLGTDSSSPFHTRIH